MSGRRKPRTTTKKVDPKELQPFYCAQDAAWGGFINIRLEDSHKALYDAWMEDNAQHIDQYIDDLVGAGMKIALAFDIEHSAYICTFTGALMEISDERFVMTTRAGTLRECLGLSCWKHIELAHGRYDDFAPRTGKFMTWG
jgi:hypothetical protein